MLTDLNLEKLKPRERAYKVYDKRGGLYLYVQPNGKRYWRCRYRINGKERHLSLGIYPDVTLIEARIICTHIKIEQARGVDLAPVFAHTKSLLDWVPRTEANIAEAVRISAIELRRHEPPSPSPSRASLEEQLSILGRLIEGLTSAIMTLGAKLDR